MAAGEVIIWRGGAPSEGGECPVRKEGGVADSPPQKKSNSYLRTLPKLKELQSSVA